MIWHRERVWLVGGEMLRDLTRSERFLLGAFVQEADKDRGPFDYWYPDRPPDYSGLLKARYADYGLYMQVHS